MLRSMELSVEKVAYEQLATTSHVSCVLTGRLPSLLTCAILVVCSRLRADKERFESPCL